MITRNRFVLKMQTNKEAGCVEEEADCVEEEAGCVEEDGHDNDETVTITD